MNRARDVRLGRDVAVKLLSDELDLGPDQTTRFEQEPRANRHQADLEASDVK